MFRAKLSLGIVAFVLGGAVSQSAYGQLIAGRSDNGEAAVFIDVTTGTPTPLFNLTDSGFAGSGVEGLAVDDANRIIYVCSGATSPDRQWILGAHYDDRDFSNPARIRLKKIVDVSPFIRLGGLAWNSTTSKLYGAYPFSAGGPEGIYEINLTSGAATVVYDFTSIASAVDLRGFDFNPADGLLYGTDLSTTAPGRALVSINLAGPSITDIAGAGVLNAPESGLAIGNGRAYIVPDDDNTPVAPIRVYNLTTNLYETPITSPWASPDRTSAGAGWGPNALVVPAGSNLGTTISATPSNALEYPVGTQINYTVKLANFGPAAATNVNYSIVLSGTATATISSVGGGNAVEGPTGTITGSEANLSSGQQFNVTFTATTTGAGTLTATASIPQGGNSDPYLGNNTEALSHVIRVYPAIDLEFTSVTASPKSAVPGGFQVENTTASTTERFRKPTASPRGDYVGFQIDTNFNGATTQDNVYVRRNASNVWSTVVQEAVTPVVGGFLVGTPGTGALLALLDDGRFGYSIDTNAPTASDEMTLLFDNTNHTVLAREGAIIPVLSGAAVGYGGTQDATQLTGDAKFAIRMSSMTGSPTAQDSGIVSDSGQRLIARETVTIPGNQLAGGTLGISTLTSDRFWMDCTGNNYLYSGTLTGSVDVIVVNGDVVFQLGGPVNTFNGTLASFSTTAGIIYAQMYANGDWYCRGTTSVSTEDFVAKGFGTSYSILAKRGDPIFTGSGENWSDVDGFGPTYFGFAANRQGSYVLTGRTDNANVSKNAVAVANGTTELFREGDRIDLDNNGFLDDDAFIDTFVVDMQLLTDARDYYAVVNLRNGAGTFIGKAVVHMANVGAPALSGADLSVTKTVSDNALDALGQQTVFTVKVCNHGPANATNVVMNDSIPSGLDFVSATNGAVETAPNSNIVTATAVSLPACTCQSYDITVQAIAPGNFNNTATATAAEADPVAANNSSSASVEVTAISDLSVTKVDNGGAPVGGQFTYTITVTNNGPAPATNVLMTDNLDPTTTFVSATNGATESSPGVVTRTFGSIANGASEVVVITVTGTVQSIVTNQVTVDGTEDDPNTNNNTAIVETVVGDVADVSVSISDPGLQVTGATFAYTLTVLNDGPATATNVQVTATLPAGLNFVSATNGAVENPPASGNITANFASIASQASQVITITVNAPAPGTYTVSASVSANEVDIDDLNNTAQLITRVGNFRPIVPVLTEIPGEPTAVAVGAKDLDGSPVVTNYTAFSTLSISPDGSKWMVRGTTAQLTDRSDVLILGTGDSGSIFAQESQPPANAVAGETYDFFDTESSAGFNSSNDFAFSARIKGGTTGTLERVYRTVSGVPQEVIRQGGALTGTQDNGGANPAGDEQLGNSVSGVHLLNDNRVGYSVTPLQNCHSDFYPGAFYDNAMFIQSGVTPLGDTEWDNLDVGTFWTTPDGLHWIVVGNKENGMITGPLAFSVDGAQTYLAGDSVGGITITAFFASSILPDGTWFVRGDDPSDNDWAVRNGTLIAASGQPIAGGSENWGVTLSSVSGNVNGDYIVAGNTNEPDVNFDSVLVLNGTTVLVREGDPVDIDENGIFDDNAYIASFKPNYALLTNNSTVHLLVTMRNSENVSLGDALVTFALPNVGCETILGDANGAGGRNGVDVQEFVDCMIAGGTLTHPCKCADMDNDGDIDAADATLFATALVGDP